MKVQGDSVDTAFKSNLIGSVFGLTAGLAAMRSAAGAVNFDNGLRYRSGFDDNVDVSPRRLADTEAQIRTSPDIEADVNARTIDDAASPHIRADAEADIVYPPKCHFNSFSEDTTVVTPDGDVPISELEVGDTVMAYDETTGVTGEYEITDTISHEDPVIVHLTIDGELIETTAEHPFYTDDGEWVNAGELEVGELIYSLDGEFGAVESVVFVADPQQMYNLTVDEAHTFFVGDGEWLVHNCGDQLELPGREWQYTETASNRLPTWFTKYSSAKSSKGVPLLGKGLRKPSSWQFRGRNRPFPEADRALLFPQGVDFDHQGFPIFDPYVLKNECGELYWYTIDGFILPRNSKSAFNLAEEKYNPFFDPNDSSSRLTTRLNATWHHLQDSRSLILVPKKLHRAPHTGGDAVIDTYFEWYSRR
jgi:hypothetical protein